VVPRAADFVVDDNAFRQRSAVVRARGADGEHIIILPHQQDGFTSDVSEQRLPGL
jgi:hypothetical protein